MWFREKVIGRLLGTFWLGAGLFAMLVGFGLLVFGFGGIAINNLDKVAFSPLAGPPFLVCGALAIACERGIVAQRPKALPFVLVLNLAAALFLSGTAVILFSQNTDLYFPLSINIGGSTLLLSPMVLPVLVLSILLLLSTGVVLWWDYRQLMTRKGQLAGKTSNALAETFSDLPTTPLCNRCGRRLNADNICVACQTLPKPRAALQDLETGHYFYLSQQYERLGRGSQSSIIFDDRRDDRYNTISQEHAAIYCNSQGVFYLRDTASTNGTLLNGQPMLRLERLPLYEGETHFSEWWPTPLKHGDEIKLGNVVFKFYTQ